MCGIFGYIGTKKIAGNLIMEGLKTLEYRGYDSWGVALKENNGNLYIEKHIGKIVDAKLPQFESSIGIGHTRWATHGGVTDANAHPQLDCNKKVVVVHNGIVENFQELKNELLKKSHKFVSETDTEVIAHFVEDELKTQKDKLKLFINLKNQLHGLNAFIVFFPENEEFYCIKNGSPIVIGQSNDHEYYIASDVTALIPHTRNVYFLENNEIVLMNRDGITLYDAKNEIKNIKYLHVDYDEKKAQKGKFKHYMKKEISEQPQVLTDIVNNQHQIIIEATQYIKNAFGTYLIGCGTASYACLAGNYLFSKIANHHVNFAIGSEFAYLNNFLKKASLVIALSQSGETIDILSSVTKAKEKQIDLIALTNTVGSSLYRLADFPIPLNAGPEKAVASTKAYTAMITYLYLIASELAGKYQQGVKDLKLAISETKTLLNRESEILEIAKSVSHKRDIFILGRGLSYPAALEASLKIKEVSYVHAEGFPAGELKHGVIALIEKGTPVIIFNPKDETYEDTLSAAHEVKARGAHVIGVSSSPDDVYDTFINVRDCGNATIIPNVVIAQLLGYFLALVKNLDPDKPRNLAKSVTIY